MNFEEYLKSFSKFQNSLHMPDVNLNKDQNKIYSHFINNVQKSTPYKHFSEKLEKIEDILKSSTKFVINVKHDGLLYTKLIQQLPTIIMKKPSSESQYVRYEGRWTSNIGSNIFKEGQWKYNDENIQWLDWVFNDQYYQAMVSSEEKIKYNDCIGNIPMLQNWNIVTPEYTCSFIIPWSYSISFGNFLPTYFCGYLDRITHEIILRRSIKDLYLVRGVKKDGSWNYLNFGPEIIASIGDVTNFKDDITLSHPELIGEYVILSNKEKDTHRCAETDKKNVIYVNDVIPLDSEDINYCGKSLSVISKKSYPIHTYMWVAQNESALKIGLYSNYSTNRDVLTYSPIEKTSITNILENVKSYETERDHVYKHFPSKPREPGFNYWTLGLKARDNYPNPSEKIDNLKIEVFLKDNNPYSSIPNTHEFYQKESDSKFRLKVRMLYLRKITITSFPSDEEKRKDFKSTIMINE